MKTFQKPIVGVISTWAENTPCNIHLHDFGKLAKVGVKEAGAWPVQFGTITVSDGIAMGTQGMRFSLTSRDIIADSIEAAMGGHNADAFVAIGGCDKPGSVIAMAGMDIPAIFAYGGTIAPGNLDGKDIDLVSVFEGVGHWNHGDMTKEEVKALNVMLVPGLEAAVVCILLTQWRQLLKFWDSAFRVHLLTRLNPQKRKQILKKLVALLSKCSKWDLKTF